VDLKEKVYTYLYGSIVNGVYLPEEAIIEQEVSDKLGISRTPVREALKKLEHEGLVTHMPSRGTFVRSVSAYDIEEIMELRIMFETCALRAAIKQLTDQELSKIESALSKLSPESAMEDFYAVDAKLHALIMKCSGNRRMFNFHEMLSGQMKLFGRISAQTPGRLVLSLDEHVQIVAALRERDYKKAEEALVSHLENVKQSTLNVWNSMLMRPGTRL